MISGLGHGQLVTLINIIGRDNLELAYPLKAHLEYLEVVVVVLM